MRGFEGKTIGGAIFDGVCHVAIAWGTICGTFAALALIWAAVSPVFGFPENQGRAIEVLPYLILGYLAIIIVILRKTERRNFHAPHVPAKQESGK